MKLLPIIIYLISFSCSADYLCGLNRVAVLQNGIVVNGKAFRYKTTLLGEKGYYFYIFEGENKLRLTQQNRLAFRNESSSWSSCKPVIYYQEQ